MVLDHVPSHYKLSSGFREIFCFAQRWRFRQGKHQCEQKRCDQPTDVSLPLLILTSFAFSPGSVV